MKTLKTILPGLLVICLVLLQGCAGNSTQSLSYDPNQRLQQVLDDYNVAVGTELNCRDSRLIAVDCSKLLQDVEALHLEFPGDSRIMMMAALLQFQLGRMQDSQYTLDQLLAKSQPAPEAAILRSRIAMAEGNSNLAREVVYRQLQRVPDYPGLYEAQAASYFLEGRYEKSLVAIDAADRLGSPAWRTNYHLGLIHEARDQYALACEHFSSVLTDRPEHRETTSRLLMLSQHPECLAPSLRRRDNTRSSF